MIIRTLEAFAGYGSTLMSLKRLEMEYPDKLKVIPVGISEIDKYAVIAYKSVHGNIENFGDITKIDWKKVPDFDLFTYSSPCQDFSQAGFQRGGEKGSGTRSSLLWECERAIREKRPKFLLFENVSGLVNRKFIKLFNQWQLTLEGYGYKNFAKVMNSKDYGVPQNRKRIFMLSIFGDNAKYEFPKKVKLKKILKDFLEEEVSEQYYLKTSMFEDIKTIGLQPMILCRPHGYFKGKIMTEYIPTLTSSNYINSNILILPKNYVKENNYRIRKLTEVECFRFMSVSDSDIDKIQASGISRSQQYKLAGNSIVVDVLYYIFRKLFIDTERDNKQLELF